MRISRKSDITAKDRKDAGRKALKSAVVKGWINVGKWGFFGDMVAFMNRYYTDYKNYNLKKKRERRADSSSSFWFWCNKSTYESQRLRQGY